MSRRRRILVGASIFTALVGGGVGAWYKFASSEPPAPPVDERSYEEIERAEYEKWMQDLGYTE